MDDKREARAEGGRRFQREGAIVSELWLLLFATSQIQHVQPILKSLTNFLSNVYILKGNVDFSSVGFMLWSFVETKSFGARWWSCWRQVIFFLLIDFMMYSASNYLLSVYNHPA